MAIHCNHGTERMNHTVKVGKDYDIRLVLVVKRALSKHEKWWIKDRQISDHRERFSLTWLRRTSSERISSITFHTVADRTVIIHSTFCILATSRWTRIDTFLVYACFILRTFWTDNAFWAAPRRTSNVSWQTRANRLIVYFSALWVWTTGGWWTWIYVCWNDC